MEKTSSRRTPSLLATFVVFLLLAEAVGGANDPNGALTKVRLELHAASGGRHFDVLLFLTPQLKLEPSVSGRAAERVDGIEYDSFVGLMGRRNAAEANSE